MYDVMLDEANLWYQEPPLRKRKLDEPSPVEEKEEEAYSSEEDMDPVEREKYRLQAVESCVSNFIFLSLSVEFITKDLFVFLCVGVRC